MPVGLQIVGRRLREDVVLQAAAYALVCPQHFRPPAFAEMDAAKDAAATVVTTGFNVR